MRFTATASAAAVIIRPHTALIAAALGLTVAWRRRALGPVIRMGASTALGLVAVMLYNQWVWGSLSISGGYGSAFTDRARGTSPLTLGSRIIELLVDLDHGIFVSSPVVALALVALVVAGRKGYPDWAIGAALGGAIYLLVQIQANRVSGGNHIFGYRYPLEAIIAAAPLLAFATHRLVATRGTGVRRAFVVLASVSIIAHGYGAVFVTA